MLMMMAYDCRVRNMNCFGAKAASANSVAHKAHDEDDDDDYEYDDEDDDYDLEYELLLHKILQMQWYTWPHDDDNDHGIVDDNDDSCEL